MTLSAMPFPPPIPTHGKRQRLRDRTRLVVRLHRASRPPERPGETLFFFSDLLERKLSSEDEGCHFLHAVVEEYVPKMLLPSLDDVVCEVIGEYENELK